MILKQLTNHLIMIRPKSFGFNPETESSNKFQKKTDALTKLQIKNKAIDEFDKMVTSLIEAGVDVMVFDENEQPALYDSVFPNNWITTHSDGTVYTYPMFSENRRNERREDIIQKLSEHFQVSKRYSLEMLEMQNQFLEGTGSMILDREHKIAYACLSPRTDARVLHKFSLLSGYDILYFNAKDAKGNLIYHTNVMMALGYDFVICCVDAIEEQYKKVVLRSFEKTAKLLIPISFEQMEKFAGNMLQIQNKDGLKILVMSSTAYHSLNIEQINMINSRTKTLVVDIPTIEIIGGGSARCMIAENFLPSKSDAISGPI